MIICKIPISHHIADLMREFGDELPYLKDLVLMPELFRESENEDIYCLKLVIVHGAHTHQIQCGISASSGAKIIKFMLKEMLWILNRAIKHEEIKTL